MDQRCLNCWGSLPHDQCPKVTIKSYITADLDNLMDELVDVGMSRTEAWSLIDRRLQEQKEVNN